jgi:DNA-binding GntR family transcriptional regulator
VHTPEIDAKPGRDKQAHSLTEKTYAGLRNDILASRLRPDERLKINELSTKLDVSPGAVRESLARLSAEGLVISETWKGYRVAPVCLEDLEDVLNARIEMETLCLRRSIANGDITWETRLVGADHRLSRLSAQVSFDAMFSNEEWAAAHADFHLSLAAACGSTSLLRLREIVFAQTERYRRLSLTPRPGRDLDAEHRAITQAAVARDTELACKLLTDHLLMARYTYLRAIRVDAATKTAVAKSHTRLPHRTRAAAARQR